MLCRPRSLTSFWARKGVTLPPSAMQSIPSPRRKAPLSVSCSRVNQTCSPLQSACMARVMSFSYPSTARQGGVWYSRMLRLASIYSCISLWWSRWLGVTLVTTATVGLLRILMSWKLDSSTTATSVGATSGSMGSSGAPMLPPRWTVRPAALNISLMRVVVVVLPSEPVTATISQGHRSKKSSTSLVTMVPAAMASCKGFW